MPQACQLFTYLFCPPKLIELSRYQTSDIYISISIIVRMYK